MSNSLFLLTLFSISTIACGHNNSIPDQYREDLLDFKANPSKVMQQLDRQTGDSSLIISSLWTTFNRINSKTNKDTIYADVNMELSKNLNYEGGCEFSNDTLFLYARNRDEQKSVETIHSTLSYKILAKGRSYKSVEFKELLK